MSLWSKVFTMTPDGTANAATAVLDRLDLSEDRIIQLELKVETLTEDLGAILEKIDMLATKAGQDVAHLRGRVEGAESEVAKMIPAINDLMLTVLKATKKVRR